MAFLEVKKIQLNYRERQLESHRNDLLKYFDPSENTLKEPAILKI